MPLVLLSSATILISSIFAFFLPYEALQLSTVSLFILGLITFLAYWDYDFSLHFSLNKDSLKNILFYLFIVFLLIPSIQWYLAHFLINDKSLKLGLFFSSICPPSLVIPLFLKNNRGLAHKAQQSVLALTCIFPLAMILLLKIYSFGEFQVSLKNLFVDILCVTVLPIFVLFLLKKLTKFDFGLLQPKYRQSLSLFCIALLTFCFFGVAYSKSNFSTVSNSDLAGLLLLVIVQDFGVYFAMQLVLRFFNKNDDILLTLLSSLRNVAIAGYVLIFFLPKAAIAPSLVMLVHSGYFIFLEYRIKGLVPLTAKVQS